MVPKLLSDPSYSPSLSSNSKQMNTMSVSFSRKELLEYEKKHVMTLPDSTFVYDYENKTIIIIIIIHIFAVHYSVGQFCEIAIKFLRCYFTFYFSTTPQPHQWRIQDFPNGSAISKGRANFYRKLHENGANLAERGRWPLRPPPTCAPPPPVTGQQFNVENEILFNVA